MDNYTKPVSAHRLVIQNRETMDVTGVLHVDSFDDEEIILETEQGLLAVGRGPALNTSTWKRAAGRCRADPGAGIFDDKRFRDRGKGLFERLFK